VPARAEVVIEGHVLPGLREEEGPFGENTGSYFSNLSPVFEASAVTHRKDFIFPALVPWTADVDTLLSLAGGAELLGQLKGLLRGVVDLELTPGTCSFAAVIAVRDCPKTEVRRLIHLALGLDRRLKSVTVVDDDIDIRNPREVAWALATRFQPARDTRDPRRAWKAM
jgi:2,5-furandicarboxylate decarboxylase 1